MIISQVKIIAFQTIINHVASGYFILVENTAYTINRKIHGYMQIPDLFIVFNMIFLTRLLHSLVRYHVQHSNSSIINKSGISSHPCIIIYVTMVSVIYQLTNCILSSITISLISTKIVIRQTKEIGELASWLRISLMVLSDL